MFFFLLLLLQQTYLKLFVGVSLGLTTLHLLNDTSDWIKRIFTNFFRFYFISLYSVLFSSFYYVSSFLCEGIFCYSTTYIFPNIFNLMNIVIAIQNTHIHTYSQIDRWKIRNRRFRFASFAYLIILKTADFLKR